MVQFISTLNVSAIAIVPFYFWVWYNYGKKRRRKTLAIVPFYFWVWYNKTWQERSDILAIVPFYFWVWYNKFKTDICMLSL